MNMDVIFGDLGDGAFREARHAADRMGVKHLNRVEPVVPAPGRPVTLRLTIGGPLPFDAACCWYCSDVAVEERNSLAAIELQPDGIS